MRSGFFNSEIIGYDVENMPVFDRAEEASFFAKYFSQFISNGVFPNPSTNMQVLATEGMKIKVDIGVCYINGYMGWVEPFETLEIEESDLQSRIDRIVARLDFTDRSINLFIKKGIARGNPVAPELQRDYDIYEIGLADIRVNANIIEITQENITDLRLNTQLCGIVANQLQHVDTTTLFNQYQDWLKRVTGQAEINISNMKTEFENNFNNWFQTVQTVLDGDVAGNLLNLINTKADKSCIDNMSKRYNGESITAITSKGFGKIRRLYGNTVQENNKTRCVGEDINMLNINVNESVLGVKVSTDNNVVTISGNSTEDGFFVLWKGILKKGTYHVRAFDTAGATTTTILRIRRGTDVIATGHMFSFTLQQDTEIFVDLWFNSEFNGTYKYAPKMVKDNPVTIWSPYKYGTVEIISKKEEVESRNITYVKAPLCCIKNEEGQIIAQDILDYENKKIIRQCKYEIINGEAVISKLPESIEEQIQCSDKIKQYDDRTIIYCRDEAVVELTLSNNKAISEINSNMKNIEDNMLLNIEEKENITNRAFNGKQIYEYMIPIEQAQINSNANLIISHNIEHLKIDKLLQLSGTIKTKVSKYWYTVPSNYNATPITLRLLDTQLQLIIPKEMSAEQFVEKGYITLLYTKNE